MKTKPPVVVCLDIGNTSTGYGIGTAGKFMRSGYWPTDNLPSEIQILMSNMNRFPLLNIVVSSVVPKITDILVKMEKRQGRHGKRVKLWIVGRNLRIGIKHKYQNLARLGSDRLVNICGAIHFYKPPLLILDYGTALTCDFISKEGIFEGGLIIPGPGIAWEALCQKAALLPKLSFPIKRKQSRASHEIIGRNTRQGMEMGILQAYGALTDGLVGRFKKRFGRQLRVVATGGLAQTVASHSSAIDIVDPLLTLNSLLRIYTDN